MVENIQVKFSELANFTPKQKQAKDMLGQFKFLLYGGAMGGGKSYWIRWTLLLQLLKWAKEGKRGVRVGLFCEDYPALKDRHLSKIQFEFPEWLGKLNKSDNEYILNPEYGSGVICFRNLDDVSKYQSAEFAMIAVDELTKNVEETFTFLRTRLRWTGIEDCKFIAGTNPGDIGHGWVRKLFIDKEYDVNEKESALFGFVQALATDNPYLSKSYITTLDSLPEELRKAFKDGDWDVFKGQFFTDWKKGIHTVTSYSLDLTQDEVFASCDWGYSHDNFAYQLHAVRKITLPTVTFNRITTFAELFGNGKLPKDWAIEIKKIEASYGLKDITRLIDPSTQNKYPADNEKMGGGSSVFEDFDKAGIRFYPANNDRPQGYQSMHTWFSIAPDKKPYHVITENCVNTIKQIPAAIFDDHNPNIVKEGGSDDCLMSLRYALISRPSNSIVQPKKVKEYTMDWFKNLKVEPRPQPSWA